MLRKIRWGMMMLRMMKSRRRKEDDYVENDDVEEEEDQSQDWDPHKSHYVQEFTGKMLPQTKTEDHTPCASLRRRNALGCFTRAILCGYMTGKMLPQTKTATHTSCQPAQAKCIWTFTKAILRKNSQVKCRRPRAARPTLCASLRNRNALECFTKQEPFHAEIYRENAGAQSEHPDQAPAFTLTLYIYIYI